MYLIEPVSFTEGTIPSLNTVSFTWVHASQGTSQVALEGKNLPVSAGDVRELGSVSGSGRSSGGGNGSPLECSCLENPMDRGAWWAAVHGITNSQT